MQDRLLSISRTCFEPEAALKALATLAEEASDFVSHLDRFEPDFLRVFVDLLVVSPPMLDSLRAHPDWVSWLRQKLREEDSGGAIENIDAEWKDYIRESGSSEASLDALRSFKRRECLGVACLDIAGLLPFEAVVLRLSNLADWVIRQALELAWKTTCQQWPAKESAFPDLGGFSIFALGKLGAQELNYSSDVDLIFCRRSSEVESELRFFTLLGEKLIHALSQSGRDGFLYRVDMRLRPHGESGPLVPTVDSLLNYYESWGEAWERQALIKARFVAGAEDLGRRFIDFASKFTFARQMDDTSLEEIKRVKHRAEKEYCQSDGRIHLKQGPGGIRDIEFYVQYMQLVCGSAHAEVRCPATLQAVEALAGTRSILEGEVVHLSLAYVLLRTLEHRLQLRSFTPQALMPGDPCERDRLARGLGFRESPTESAAQCMDRVLSNYRALVRSILERIYLTPGYLRLTERDEELARLLSDRTPRERVREILGQYGFIDVDKAWQNIRLLALGPAGRLLPPAERRAFLEFAYPLLEVLRDSIDPDLALHRLEIFAAASGNRISFLRALASRRPHLQRLVNLLALSDLAHQILSRHPEYFDSLARGIHLHNGRTWEEMHTEIRQRLGASPRGETPDMVLRKYRQREMSRIAYRDLAGLADSLEISGELSALGQACARSAWELTRPSQADGIAELRDPLTVIACGKLGSRQMHYSSDLDLILLYQDPDEELSPGERERTQREQDARVERIVEMLSGVTSEGVVYDLDLRLRPEGATGLLARSWISFGEYMQRSMQPWERMALIRSRLLCSSDKAESRWNGLIRQAVYQFEWNDDSFQELRHLKKRIESEKNRESRINIDFKYGKGGVVDLEFLVQWLQIHYGRENENVRTPNLAAAIAALESAGAVSALERDEILRIHRLQRLVENRYQLLEEWNSREVSRESSALERLARSLGYGNRAGLGARRVFLDEWDAGARFVRRLVESNVFA